MVNAENAVAKLEKEQNTAVQEDADEDTDTSDETIEETEDPGFIGGLLENAGNIVNGAKEGVSEAITSVADNLIVSVDPFKNILNNFIELIYFRRMITIMLTRRYVRFLHLEKNGNYAAFRKEETGADFT